VYEVVRIDLYSDFSLQRYEWVIWLAFAPSRVNSTSSCMAFRPRGETKCDGARGNAVDTAWDKGGMALGQIRMEASPLYSLKRCATRVLLRQHLIRQHLITVIRHFSLAPLRAIEAHMVVHSHINANLIAANNTKPRNKYV